MQMPNNTGVKMSKEVKPEHHNNLLRGGESLEKEHSG